MHNNDGAHSFLFYKETKCWPGTQPGILKSKGGRELYKNIVFSGGWGQPWRCSEIVNWRLTTVSFFALLLSSFKICLIGIVVTNHIILYLEGGPGCLAPPSGYTPGIGSFAIKTIFKLYVICQYVMCKTSDQLRTKGRNWASGPPPLFSEIWSSRFVQNRYTICQERHFPTFAIVWRALSKIVLGLHPQTLHY